MEIVIAVSEVYVWRQSQLQAAGYAVVLQAIYVAVTNMDAVC